MENPEKIEIEGLKTIHKLCKFGADHNMEGCTFTEIVERMFSKIEQMKTQVNTLDEMLLNQGEALAQAKAQAVPEWISVKDKLPPENILVLGMSQTPRNIFNIYNVMALDEFEEADVTHWMPLPDAPQELVND